MSVKLSGYSAGSALEVNTQGSVRAAIYPPDWSQYPSAPGGSYSRTLVSAPDMVGGFSGSAFQFRWTSPGLICGVRRVLFTMVANSASKETLGTLSLFFARLFSVAGSGGNAWSGANNAGKRRAKQEPTLVADMRIAPSPALTAGTWVLDADPISAVTFSWPNENSPLGSSGFNGIRSGYLYPLWQAPPGEHPVALAAQEGLDINFVIAPASNNYQLTVCVEWDELAVI